ncbi:Fmu (Sun) domain-containing protein [Melioribacter roseus P3M-2]|uniref:Fmu (Sun) domain-containing protein n=1 Tax=Melioribacter roseus (strain DSM 23840 / JCM 17771 / VKM B-2668 / P3M-2) TaxID=1191523 RepID=I6ZSE8_MELRP|nr:class I SAM-dependent rRNA methyltransferase [Melioribacter roseus]AFN74944.1 Fmu (Sun) domain-containing protein [Melioribacter roseus P3M-2]
MNSVILGKNEDRRIKKGHLWIFSNEIKSVEGSPENGELVRILDAKRNYLGTGFYNKNSLISVRFISKQKEVDLTQLFKSRILNAFAYRKKVYPNRESFRLIFSESDLIPGLIIDKYNNSYALQVYSAGIEKNINVIVDILKKELGAKNIFTKNEEYFRRLEGLPVEDYVYAGEMEKEIIDDGSIKYEIDFSDSHKTGFYFDQCDNRQYAGRFCNGFEALDCFCNSGGFGLHAAYNKCKSITFVDSSAREIERAEHNFKLNSFAAESSFIVDDVFDFLNKKIEEGKKYDVVIIDPPAFAKNKKNLPAAIKGYEKLNGLAMNVLKDGGVLFTSSCSYHLRDYEFINVINNAANKNGRYARIIYFNHASLDHPRLTSMEETVYLKFAGVILA